MHTTRLLLSFLLTALTVTALPLNINLGAYSPAMVVGDGAISFEEGEAGEGAAGGEGAKAESVIHTLQGGSASRGITTEVSGLMSCFVFCVGGVLIHMALV